MEARKLKHTISRKVLSLSELAELIKKLSEKSPHTITDIFKYAGIPLQYFSSWKKNKGRAPYYHELAKFAEILDKPVETFIYVDVEADQDSYVHIEKEKYERLLKNMDHHLQELLSYKKTVT